MLGKSKWILINFGKTSFETPFIYSILVNFAKSMRHLVNEADLSIVSVRPQF